MRTFRRIAEYAIAMTYRLRRNAPSILTVSAWHFTPDGTGIYLTDACTVNGSITGKP